MVWEAQAQVLCELLVLVQWDLHSLLSPCWSVYYAVWWVNIIQESHRGNSVLSSALSWTSGFLLSVKWLTSGWNVRIFNQVQKLSSISQNQQSGSVLLGHILLGQSIIQKCILWFYFCRLSLCVIHRFCVVFISMLSIRRREGLGFDGVFYVRDFESR